MSNATNCVTTKSLLDTDKLDLTLNKKLMYRSIRHRLTSHDNPRKKRKLNKNNDDDDIAPIMFGELEKILV